MVTEAELEDTFQELIAIVKSSDDAIIGKNLDGTITSWNHGAEAIYGYSADETIGKSISIIIPPEYINELVDILYKVKHGERINHYETVRVRKDGKRLDVSTTISPLINKSGEIVGASSITRDIAVQKRTEKLLSDAALIIEKRLENSLLEANEKLSKSNKELRQTNKELQQFVYVASHDLQEPLRMIASFLELLSRRYSGKLDKDADDFIKYAVDGAICLQIMITDLLSLSRIDNRGKEFTDVDMKIIIQEVLTNLVVAIDDVKANISVGDMPTIKANRSEVIQLIQNLVENAIKFRGKDPPKIEISAKRGKGEWIFSVRDNGIGIDSQYFERIFVIFQRLHSGDVYEGTGIGLAIAKKIVERHWGHIWLESEIDKGSTFYFTIPDVRNESDDGGGNYDGENS